MPKITIINYASVIDIMSHTPWPWRASLLCGYGWAFPTLCVQCQSYAWTRHRFTCEIRPHYFLGRLDSVCVVIFKVTGKVCMRRYRFIATALIIKSIPPGVVSLYCIPGSTKGRYILYRTVLLHHTIAVPVVLYFPTTHTCHTHTQPDTDT